MKPRAATPLDVRLMNWTAMVLLVGCALALLAGAGGWLLRQPVFALARIVVQGDLVHTSALSLRANVAPQLAGNFFTIDLGMVQQAFEQVPWVRRAQVRREFPGSLRVQLQEHDVAALWGEEGGARLVNSHGELFDAEPDDGQEARLARLIGGDAQAPQMLAMLARLEPALAPLASPIVQLRWNAHGSWRVRLASGAVLQLGAGEADELLERVRRLVQTLARVAHEQGRRVEQLEYADLRYASGYALRLRGVTTVEGDAPRNPARLAPPKNQRG